MTVEKLQGDEYRLEYTRREYDQMIEGLKLLRNIKANQRRVAELELQRKTLSREIDDINLLINKIKERL